MGSLRSTPKYFSNIILLIKKNFHHVCLRGCMENWPMTASDGFWKQKAPQPKTVQCWRLANMNWLKDFKQYSTRGPCMCGVLCFNREIFEITSLRCVLSK